MSRVPEENTGSNLLTFLVGVAVGGVIVALITPKRGSELREDISSLGGKAKDQIGSWVDSASDAVEGIKSSWKRKGEAAIQEVKAKAGDVAGKTEDAWKEVKESASKAGNDIKSGFTGASKDVHP